MKLPSDTAMCCAGCAVCECPQANTRNMKLLQDHLEHPKQATRADTCFLFGLFFLVVVVPVVLVMGTVAAIVLGILAAFGKLG
jgi:hypothetical protein